MGRLPITLAVDACRAGIRVVRPNARVIPSRIALYVGELEPLRVWFAPGLYGGLPAAGALSDAWRRAGAARP